MIKARYTDADGNPAQGLKEMASIPSVPLIFPASKSAIMTFPVAVGDLVLLLFSERSIDAFKYSDGKNPIDPKDLRKHEYTDAIAICGMFTYPTALGIHPTDTVIRMNAGKENETKISLKPNGDIVADSSAKFIVNSQSDTVVNSSANVEVNVSGTTTVTSSGLVKIDASNTTITGSLRVDGGVSVGADVSTDAGITLKTHKHVGNLGKPTSVGIP
jgi:phage baseplate assembly protein gpV